MYLIIKKVYRLLYVQYSFFFTYLKFRLNNVKFQNFKTAGIPYLMKDSNSEFIIGKYLKINNCLQGNSIGQDKCSFRILKNKISAPVSIGDDVFIGTQVMILKGVNIGERSIIGARSLVVKDVPEGEIWAGNPARFIRKITSTNT